MPSASSLSLASNPTERWMSLLRRSPGRAAGVHPDLRAVLDATPSEHLTFLTMTGGKPYAGEHFSKTFPRVVRRCRTAEALFGTWLEEGCVSAAGRSRVLGKRDRRHLWTR